MSVICMSRDYRVLPSELMGLEDPYTAFCFNEAVYFIKSKLDNGEKPVYTKQYSSFTDIYKKYDI